MASEAKDAALAQQSEEKAAVEKLAQERESQLEASRQAAAEKDSEIATMAAEVPVERRFNADSALL